MLKLCIIAFPKSVNDIGPNMVSMSAVTFSLSAFLIVGVMWLADGTEVLFFSF